jgi:hypothetical protein
MPEHLQRDALKRLRLEPMTMYRRLPPAPGPSTEALERAKGSGS